MSVIRSWTPKRDPWHPPDHDEQVIWAVRAFFKGEATQSQQFAVRDYLMYITGASDEWADLSYRPGEDGRRATDFAEGKRFPGLMLRKLLRPELTPRGENEVDVPRVAAPKPKRPRKKRV